MLIIQANHLHEFLKPSFIVRKIILFSKENTVSPKKGLLNAKLKKNKKTSTLQNTRNIIL